MYLINVKFELNGTPCYTKGFAPCTEKAFQKKEFSERYIIKCAYCHIYGYMEVQNLEGSPELVSWEFDHTNG